MFFNESELLKNMGKKNNLYGLVGKDIDYSFSRTYFNNKFNTSNQFSSFRYKNFDIKNISEISEIFKIKNFGHVFI